MNINQNKTITYIDTASNRPILSAIYDQGAKSYADENINFAEVAEALEDITTLSTTSIFEREFKGQHNTFLALLEEALNLTDHVQNLDEILLVLKKMLKTVRILPSSACTSFVITQLKPFLKEERHQN